MTLHDKIKHRIPFRCKDFKYLKKLILKVFNPPSGVKYAIDNGFECISNRRKCKGSWNIPVKFVEESDLTGEVYKVFKIDNGILKYEFHDAEVIMGKWLTAKNHSTTHLTGFSPEYNGRFHFLYNIESASVYLEESKMYNKEPLKLTPVSANRFQTIDLIYSPPVTFTWGIDAEELFVENKLI
jgi:hypothetical protein